MPIDGQDVVYKQGLYTSFFVSTAPQGAPVYRVDQKVLSGISIPSYGKTWTNFLANPVFWFLPLMKEKPLSLATADGWVKANESRNS